MNTFEQFEHDLGRAMIDLELLKTRFFDLQCRVDEQKLNNPSNFWSKSYLDNIKEDLDRACDRSMALLNEPFQNTKKKIT
jgi:hypothetical protein